MRVFYDYNVVGIWQYDDPHYVKKEVDGKIVEGFFNEKGEEIQAGAKPGFAKLEDVDGNGKITAADKKVIGSRTPSFLLSMGNQFNYKNFSFSFLLNGTFGQWKERIDLDIPQWTNNTMFNYLSGMNYWTPENPTNEITCLNYTRYGDHHFYSKVNYVTVKNISLGYDLEKKWLRTLGISALNINLSVNNLCSFSNVDNTTNLDADNMYYGYPTNRSYMLGLNLTF